MGRKNKPAKSAPESENLTQAEIAAERAKLIAEAAANLNAPKTKPARVSTAAVAPKVVGTGTRAANKAPVTVATAGKSTSGNSVNPNSIRQVLRNGLIAGQTTVQLTALLSEKFPGTQAALKPSVHIGFYRSKLRKEGKLPPVQRKALPVTAPSTK